MFKKRVFHIWMGGVGKLSYALNLVGKGRGLWLVGWAAKANVWGGGGRRKLKET